MDVHVDACSMRNPKLTSRALLPVRGHRDRHHAGRAGGWRRPFSPEGQLRYVCEHAMRSVVLRGRAWCRWRRSRASAW
eukprot:395040-Rhodomonas_salina.4